MNPPSGIYNPALKPKVGSGEGTDIINTLLGNFLGIALVIGTLMAFYFLVTGAIQLMTAGDDKNKVASSKNRIVYGLGGLVILFSAFMIMKLVGSFFGISTLENLLFDLSPFIIK